MTADVPLPADLVPSLLEPGSAGPAKRPPARCGLSDPDVVSPACVSGVADSATTVVLFGDSHVGAVVPGDPSHRARTRMATHHPREGLVRVPGHAPRGDRPAMR